MSKLSTVNEDDECRTCGKTYGWHLENNPVHPFNNDEAGATAFLGPRRDRDTSDRGSRAPRDAENPPTVVWPTDPVLRVALIAAGVISADDLRKAEDMLKASIGLTGKGDNEGVQNRGTPQGDSHRV